MLRIIMTGCLDKSKVRAQPYIRSRLRGGQFYKKIINRDFVCVIDVEEGYIREIRDTFKSIPDFKAFKYDISSAEVRELKQERFDTIVCFNVLEHIENDGIALDNMYHLLEDGGHLCLIVPAFQLIFGAMDTTDNHYRRYTKRIIVEKIKRPALI